MNLNRKKIVACLDVANGMLVKGIQFDQVNPIMDPVEAGLKYVAQGIDELVYYDISATVEGRGIFERPIVELAGRLDVPFTVGGGIRSIDDIERVLKLGADKVSINSAALDRPELIREAAEKFGSQTIMGSMDVKKDDQGQWRVYRGAGKVATERLALPWAEELAALGAGELCINSIDQDGMRNGYDLELLRELKARVDIPLIASGGAGTYEHFLQAFEVGAASALGASVFHFGLLEIPELKRIIRAHEIDRLKFDDQGLIPVAVQDARTKDLLMLAYMNRESIDQTLATGNSWFYSRSRQELWEKGATSGNTQKVVSLAADCDGDALLMCVLPAGPACHTGQTSCFYKEIETFSQVPDRMALFNEFKLLKDRRDNPKAGSYTNYLFDQGIDKICKKIGEEAAETIIAAKNNDQSEILYESSDLLYHLNVLLIERGVELDEVMAEVAKRIK